MEAEGEAEMTTGNSIQMHDTNDYIRRGDAVYAVHERILQIGYQNDTNVLSIRQAVRDVAPSDVVTRDAFNRILAENDDMRELLDMYGGEYGITRRFEENQTMRDQLASIGKSIGEDMSDVRKVRNDRWELDSDPGEPWRYSCPVCGEKCKETVMGRPRWNYCPMCGTLLENNL